jgi:hypothetical protein
MPEPEALSVVAHSNRPRLKYHAKDSAQKEVAKHRKTHKELTVENWRELLKHDDEAWGNMEREETKMLEEQVYLSCVKG